jgi:hypothetical protein
MNELLFVLVQHVFAQATNAVALSETKMVECVCFKFLNLALYLPSPDN